MLISVPRHQASRSWMPRPCDLIVAAFGDAVAGCVALTGVCGVADRCGAFDIDVPTVASGPIQGDLGDTGASSHFSPSQQLAVTAIVFTVFCPSLSRFSVVRTALTLQLQVSPNVSGNDPSLSMTMIVPERSLGG